MSVTEVGDNFRSSHFGDFTVDRCLSLVTTSANFYPLTFQRGGVEEMGSAADQRVHSATQAALALTSPHLGLKVPHHAGVSVQFTGGGPTSDLSCTRTR